MHEKFFPALSTMQKVFTTLYACTKAMQDHSDGKNQVWRLLINCVLVSFPDIFHVAAAMFEG